MLDRSPVNKETYHAAYRGKGIRTGEQGSGKESARAKGRAEEKCTPQNVDYGQGL